MASALLSQDAFESPCLLPPRRWMTCGAIAYQGMCPGPAARSCLSRPSHSHASWLLAGGAAVQHCSRLAHGPGLVVARSRLLGAFQPAEAVLGDGLVGDLLGRRGGQGRG